MDYPPSGVVGAEGRVPAIREPGRSASLVLAGRTLPLVSRMRVYTCGITPYDVTHLGHASVFVWSDLLRSLSRLLDVEPTLVRNVTDIDDVLTTAALRDGRNYDQFAVAQEFAFDQDMRALAVATPDEAPRARAHVGDVVQLAAGLLATGDAYESGGAVFFRGAGVVEGRDRAEALALSAAFGDQDDDGREDPFDVPVWRPSTADQPAWPSPWGWGRPGWHAECAAMALDAHGPSLDVLVGGADLAFPHHTYQIAMAEAVSGVRPLARRLMHIGTVRAGGEKMAKSTGNLVLVRDLLGRHSGADLRLLLLDRPWAGAWDFEPAALAAAEERRTALYAKAGEPGRDAEGTARVIAALLADLDVPRAVEAALTAGGEAARLLIRLLKLGEAA